MSLFRIPCFFSIVVLTRSTLVREAIPRCGSTVSALNQYMNGVTRWVILIESDFACIMCHSLEGDRNGDTISGCTRGRGDRNARGNDTLSSLWVSSSSLWCPGVRRANPASIYASCGNSTLLRVSHSGSMTTMTGN